MAVGIDECPVCSGDSLHQFDRINSIDGNVSDIAICPSCEAILNRTQYELLQTENPKKLQENQFYVVGDEEPVSHHETQVSNWGALFDWLSDRDPRNTADLTLCDYGCGRGYLALAAAGRYRRVIACDWDLGPIKSVLHALEQPKNLILDTELLASGIDVLVMWHTLEHMPDPSSFWRAQRPRFRDDAMIVLQVPMYRPQHICQGHYIFYTEASLRRWAASIDAEPIEFGYDVPNNFLAMVARILPR